MTKTKNMLNKLIEFLKNDKPFKKDVLFTPDECTIYSLAVEVMESNHYDIKFPMRKICSYPRKYLILKSIYNKLTTDNA